MSGFEIEAPVRTLVAERVHGYEQLEALLFLHAHATEDSTPEAVAGTLRIPVEAATRALEDLVERGLASVQEGGRRAYRFDPATPEVAAAVAALARVYAEQRLAIIKLLSDHAIERLRTGAARAFADSFLVGRRKK
jgi:predicted ArsR family transcriptional regulator